ncbi:MAG: TetR/AcrR family transcriptional regulator [Verrucomicrobiota bacterium]
MGRTSNAKNQLLDAMVDLMWERSYGSLTIDLICEKADVKKGSFYYFFKSKLDLGIAAMDHIWEHLQPTVDANFSPSRPPLERIAIQVTQAYTKTKEIAEEHGYVLGCPYFNIGAEISTIEPELVEKVNQLLARFQRYFENAVIEAVANDDIPEIDPKEAGRIIFNLYEGMITQARMKNDVELLRDLPIATARILGIKALPQLEAEAALTS